MSTPTSTTAWVHTSTIKPTEKFIETLQKQDLPLPALGPKDVLVRLHAASFNYRDILIPRDQYPFPVNWPLVPMSDGAGEVVAVGPQVKSLAAGDNVMTVFNQEHQAGRHSIASATSGLGGALHGVLREYAVFPEYGVMKSPKGWTHEQAATLPCAAVTAWNALKDIKAGQSVLVQGTGGVSLFALQFAKAMGAFVVATTSSKAKEEQVKALGADVVINYVETPQWGEVAKKASPRGEGIDVVVEIGGPATLQESFRAVRMEGTIAIIGYRAGPTKDGEKEPGWGEILANVCQMRAIFVGSRAIAEEMVSAIEVAGLKPVVDPKVWNFDEAPQALDWFEQGRHVGKVVIKI
ncbi:zinc-binding oxidoreductase [Pyronema omphalodes]|nr:zinc-binding oxidoreductase [Pyronema omphalodes]